jgi:hypothetical protein
MHTTEHAAKTHAADGYADKHYPADGSSDAPVAAEHSELMSKILAGLDAEHPADGDDGSQDDGSAPVDDGSGGQPQDDGSQGAPDDSGSAPVDDGSQGDSSAPVDDGSASTAPQDDGSSGQTQDDAPPADDGSGGGSGGGGSGGGTPPVASPVATFTPAVPKIGFAPRPVISMPTAHPLPFGGVRPTNIAGGRPTVHPKPASMRRPPHTGIHLADDDGYGPYEAPANMGDMGADIFATLLHPLKPMVELVHPPVLAAKAKVAAPHPAAPVHAATFAQHNTGMPIGPVAPKPGLHLVPNPGKGGVLTSNTGIAGGVHPAYPVGHGGGHDEPEAQPSYGQRVGVAFREKPILFLVGLAAVMYLVFVRDDGLWNTVTSTGGKTRKHDKVETFTEEIHTKRESVLGKPTFPAPVAAS